MYLIELPGNRTPILASMFRLHCRFNLQLLHDDIDDCWLYSSGMAEKTCRGRHKTGFCNKLSWLYELNDYSRNSQLKVVMIK